MDRQGTTSIRRTKKETHNGTSDGSLQPHCADQDRDRRTEICLLWYTVTARRRGEMETSGLQIENHARRQMQLGHPRQRIIGNNPGLQGMEEIRKRKPKAYSSVHRP